MRYFARPIRLLLPVTLSGIGILTSTTAGLAQSTPTVRPPFQISQSFKPPSRGTAPPSAGGATRGETCLTGDKPLTSLVPPNLVGLTHSSHPTVFWYLPQSPAKTAKFLLLSNDDSDVVFETTLNLPGTAGVVSFTLPEHLPPLEMNKQYHWYLVLGCSQTDQSANPSVEGWVERVTPDAEMVSQLQKADLRQKAKIYAENGIWYEAVMTIAELRRTKPQDATAIAGWQELLKSVKLDAIAAEPLLNTNIGHN